MTANPNSYAISQSRRLIHNTFVIWLMRFIRYIPELLLVPFVLNRLGPEAFGIYVLAWSILTAMERVQEPVTSAVIKYGANYLAKNKTDCVNRIVSTAFSIAVIVAVLSFVGILSVALLSHGLFSYSSLDSYGLTFFCMLIVAVTIILSYPMMPFVGTMYALQRHDLFFIMDTSAAYLKAFLVVCWFMFVSPSTIVLMIIAGLAFLIPRLIMAIRAYRVVPNLEFKKEYINSKDLRLISSFAGILFIASLCYIVNFTGIKWIMGIIASATFVAHLEILLIPSRVVGQITHGMTLTVMPAASKLKALRDSDRLNELFIRGTRYINILIVLEIIAASLLIRPVLRLWLGAEYLFLYKYLVVFFCFNALKTTGYCANQILRGGGNLHAVLNNSLIGQALTPVGVSLVLYHVTNDPYWSVTIGLSTGSVVYGLMQIISCKIALKTPFREMMLRSFLQPALIGFPLFVFCLMLNVSVGPVNMVAGVLMFCVAGMFFLAVFYRVFATLGEKNLTAEYVTGRFRTTTHSR